MRGFSRSCVKAFLRKVLSWSQIDEALKASQSMKLIGLIPVSTCESLVSDWLTAALTGRAFSNSIHIHRYVVVNLNSPCI